MARVDTVAGASICIVMEEVMLTQYIFPLKKKLGQKTKISEISVSKPHIYDYCLPPYAFVLGQN
ncbi:hypothetical protein E2I00_009440 [Balaenoptera physalus]|uniref:Uncharacterized protein n=1 Tax=Balaenoptera physalus TaxID=9770 RepID=A0A643CDD3_BALPH|nr:hypothetical protein E2I00_009440 [Balaenoptera physalus]